MKTCMSTVGLKFYSHTFLDDMSGLWAFDLKFTFTLEGRSNPFSRMSYELLTCCLLAQTK